jgi:hypothetical protein
VKNKKYFYTGLEKICGYTYLAYALFKNTIVYKNKPEMSIKDCLCPNFKK